MFIFPKDWDDVNRRNMRKTLIKEWALLALSLGAGGHIALAYMLHAPELWPWHKAGTYSLLIGLSTYVALQMIRSIWWICTEGRRKHREDIALPHP